LTADGQHDSHAITLADGGHNGSPRAGQPYRRITWGGIAELVESPSARTKDRAALVILSTYAEHDGRTHQVQRERGSYGGLAVDIDKGNPSLEQVVAALRDAVGDVAAFVYSSSSAEPDNRKWRILLPLSESIAGSEYADTQSALFELLAARGIVCDPTLARSAQPVFLPNVPPKRRGPDGRPVFYRSLVLRGPRLRLDPGSRVGDARAGLRDRRAAAEQEAARVAAANREHRLARVAATGDVFDAIEHFKQNHTVGQLLARYGFERSPRQRGSHWKSPLSTSGSYSTEDRGDHWIAVSAWAHEHNVGRVSSTGHRYGDAFDLFVAFEHNGDKSAAVRAYAALVRPQRPAGKQKPAPVRIEPLEPVAELIPIDQYRRDLQQAIAESVLDGSPGVKLLRGAPGCGKTTAVLRAVARYGRGVVSVPSHELAAEVVEKLQEAGADAAAYPKLDESTCQNYAAACRARARGLSVAASVCPTCPLLRECRESGYVAGVKRASEASHQVVTHSRFARSAGKLTKRAEYVVLEEDPTAALRPTATATRRELHRLSDLADVYADAERRARILDGSDLVVADVEPLAEFAAFAPDEQGEPGEENGADCTISAGDGGGQVTARYLRESEPPAPRRTYPRGFFGSLCRIADELAAGITAAIVDEQGPAVRELHVKPCSDPPKNPDGSVWRALEMIDRVDPDGTAGISEECLRLVVAVATGRVRSLYVQIDTDARPGAPDRRSASVVGIWQTGLPDTNTPVYVNDGTLDVETLRRIVRGDVVDITPPGSAPVLHASIQYAADILPTTSSAKVAAILTGIARANPDRERLGVVLHQRHYRALLEAEQSPLPSDVRSRIAWATYFGSGADRGTNTLHQVADLAVVIGTHRPPPSEIRRTLLRWGELEAASGSATWGAVDRHAVGPDGAAVEYVGRGYGELAWARAADACTRAAMRQAVGRARAITPDGVPVVAVTTESTGLPVAPADALPVADLRLDLVLAAVAGAVAQSVKMGNSEPAIGAEYRAENPIDRYRENCAILPGGSVPVDEVEKRLPGVSSRSVQVWLREAIDAGLVVRTGAARATRYGLAGPAPAALAVEPASSTPVVVTITPVAAPVVEPARPLVAEKPAARPVVAPAVEPKPLSLARISPPPVVAEKPPASDWLDVVLSPERHPDDVLSLRFYLDGPYANDVGQGNVWASDVTPGLVAKLHTTATAEAKRRGQPPPPIDLVARHTSAWFSVAAAG
jgi:hypothetical protein